VIESGPADARERAARARAGSPPIASVSIPAGYPREVDGGDVAELKPGYWALVAGVCATRAEADAVLARLRGERFTDAYLKPTRSAAVAVACPALRPAWDRAEQLVTAAEAGDGKRVRALIAAGADVNHVTGSGATALGVAAYGGHEDAVRVLLAAGAKPDVRGAGAQQETPLMSVARSPAAPESSVRIARLLIARGADVNATTEGAEADYGTSPLTEALSTCRPALVRLLLARRARVVINGSRRRCGTPDYPGPAEIQNLLARIKLDLR
jgi:hypothetical protein